MANAAAAQLPLRALEGALHDVARTYPKVVGSLGFGRRFVGPFGRFFGRNKGQNALLAISTSKKTYPDEKVLEMANWGADHFKNLTLIIADNMQKWVKVGLGEADYNAPDEVAGDYYRRAVNRKRELASKLEAENVRVMLMDSEFLPQGDPLDYLEVLINATQVSGPAVLPLDDRLQETVRANAPHLIKRANANGYSEPYASFWLSQYAAHELLFSLTAAEMGITIKIGPPSERIYDMITKDWLDGRFSWRDPNRVPSKLKRFRNLIRHTLSERVNFGAIYLE